MEEDVCPYCSEGFVQIKTPGVPDTQEPCAVCRPDEAALAWRRLQKRLNKETPQP